MYSGPDENLLLSSLEFIQQKEYWVNKLSCDIERIDIFSGAKNKKRPKTHKNRDCIEIILPADLCSRVLKLSKHSDLSIYLILLAVLNTLIFKYTGNENVIIASPVYAPKAIENTLNTRVFIQVEISGNMTFKELLLNTRQAALAAYENQDYPSDKLIEYLYDADVLPDKEPPSNIRCALQNIHHETPDRRIETDLIFTFVREGEQIRGTLVYNPHHYDAFYLEQLPVHLVYILEQSLRDIHTKIAEIFLLGDREKEELLFEFNNTRAEYVTDKTIHSLLEQQVVKIPDKAAVVFEGQQYTYKQLNEKVNQLARRLRKKGVKADKIIAIMVERSLEMITAIFAVLKAGAAYLPIDPEYPAERMRFLLKDSGSELLLTQKHLGSENEHLDQCIPRENILFLDDETLYSGPVLNLDNVDKPQDPAYVIYTSGTTGKPKGVMIEHRNVINLVCGLKERIYSHYHNYDSLNVALLSPYVFDASVKQIFGALLQGYGLYIAPEEARIDGFALLEFYHNHSIDISDGTPIHMGILSAAMEQSVSKPAVKHFLIGGEALPGKVVEDFLGQFEQNAPIITNVYGPTECSVDATAFEITRENNGLYDMIPLGKPMPNFQVYILDKEKNLLPVGIAGELCIAGKGVSRGYLNNPGLTAEKFIRSPFISSMTRHQKAITILYCTGDFASWMPNGDIEFLGRIDHQVKIRGFRIELEEIESHLLGHSDIKDAVVMAKGEEEKFLCAYFISDKEPDALQLRDYLSRFFPDYAVPTHLVQIPRMPLTPNGKVDRRALPEPKIKTGKDYAPPRHEIEKELVEIWSGVLFNRDASHGTAGSLDTSISIDDNFFQLGGHSLKATILAARIQKEFNVNIPLVKIFRSPTVRELAEYIKKEAPQKLYISIPPTEKKEYYILSSAQKRLYILQQMDMGNTVYNMPQIIPLPMKPEVDNGKLENTFKSLIARHQSLRTSFHMVNDQPVQKIHDEVGFEIEYFGVEQGAESLDVCCADIIRDFIGPFDLSKAPLLRVGMIKLSEEGTTSLMAGGAAAHILLVDMHHIISDGISLDLLTDEFAALYQGGELPPLRLRYNDYAQWQTSAVRENILKNQETFWLNQFKGEISLLNLPADFPRPPLQSFAGSNLGFTITAEETRDLKTLAAREDATLYMVMLSLFIVFLAKISGSEDIIIGTPIAGREHADLEKIIGMFVNTLVLRNFPIGSKSFRLFIKEVKERTLAAFENQAYQFEDLVEKIDTRRDTGRNPVFDVMFDLQARDRQPPPGLETKAHPPIAPYRYDNRISKFDMTLTVVAEGNYLLFNFEYCTKLFKKETIERFTRYFKIILSLVLKNPGSKIAEISILPEEDRKQILYHFNHTDAQYPRDKTVHQLFAEQAEKTPHRIAVSGDSRETAGKEGRKGDTTQLTYRELNQKAGQLAGWLRGKGVLPDHIVGIMIEPSIEMSIALLGVLMAGGGYMPISPDYPEERINYMLTDSNARVLLSEVSEVLDLSLPPASLASPSNLAYVIYTSGSTGRPKGVLVEHRSLVNYVFAFLREFVLFPTDTMLQQASFTFDAFAEEFFPILLTGGKLFIPAEIEVKDIYRLSPIIVKHDVTLISASPLLLNELNKIDRFPSLRIYISGADVLKWHYIDNLLETGVIYNTYGPTETVVCATYYKCREQTFSNVPIGKPITNYRVYITDKQERLQPIGVPGELCISGPGVARGYLNKPELTAEKFVFYRSHSPKKIYKTGDLARWLPDGNIEFLGRLDYQVKIRGYRIETGEIENCLLNEEDISEAVVIDREDREGHKYLCAYIVSGKKCNLAELRHKLSKKLPDYMVPGYFMQLDNIPLSPEGKINRRALRALPPPEMRAVQGVVPPRDKIEKTLVELWSHVLDIQEEKIGIDAEFFQLGGHSLKAVTLLSRIHKELNVNIPLTEIFKTPTIRGLRAYIREAANDQYVSIRIAEKREYYHLSSAQKRLYMLHHMEEQNITYNMPQIIPLPLEIDKKKLENTFRKLIWRHESLRTSFFMIKSEPVQMIHDRVEFEIEQHTPAPAGRPPQEGNSLALRNPLPGGGPGDWSGLEQFIRPFDLSKAPLLRVGLIHFPPLTVEPGEHSIQEGIPGHKHILLVDMHHIISDGISHGILEHEFMALSRDEELPSLPIQYKDFSHWQNSTREKENIKQQQEYWLREFEGEIPVLDLPIDYPRPTVQNFEGAVLDFEVSGDHTRTLKAIALAGGSTLYMILLTLINILLSKLSGQEDIIIGTPIAGRRHADLEKIIGMFVNTLALRNFPRREKSLNEFFKEVTQRTLSAFENQEYPFEDLVEKVNVARDAARNPVFDVMIVFQNIDIGIAQDSHPGKRKVEIPSSSQEYSYENKTAKFDLTLTLTEFPGKLLGSLNYCIRLFKPKTSERFIGYFKRIISQVCENERLRLADIEIISPDEKTQILIDFNQTEASYPRRKTIHQLFAQQVEKSGDGVAIVCLERSAGSVEFVGDGTVHLTYGGLNRKSNQLAQLLGEKGIMPGELVGILVDRSPEMIIGILGILKAGAGYVPLNPAAPTARTKYMAEECDVKIGLTLSPLLDEDNIPFENYLYIDEYHHYANMSEADPARNAVPGDWAYVIFTSGSTGKPKGVPIAHANLSPLLHWGYRHLGLGIKDRTIQNLSYYFDWSVWEIFITLTTGSGLYIVPEDLQLNPGVCINLINKQGITVLHATPSHYRYFANMGLPLETLKYLFLGAEKLTQDLVQRSFESVSPNCRVFNMYGPTECTIITNVLEIHQEDNNKFQYLSSVPIGGPAANFNLLVLDKSLNVCPVNITGEMYIGGDGVAEGYLNRPELTAEKFVSVSYKSYRAYRAYISRKIYKTGDLVRWLSDGNIEFLGRIDFQVKIRGFRIELGEIEKQLTGHPAIKETVVLVLGEEQQEKFLCAYVILNNDKEKLFDETPGIPGELNAYLSQTLPDYMIPSHFIPIQKIPLTPNGKLDRRALPLPEAQSPLSGKYVPPANEIEKQLAAIWAEVLARDPLHAPIGIDDDFFELGGHSLKATVLTTKILEEFNLRVPLVEIFKSPTIRKLTGYIKHSHRDLVWEKDENIVLIRKKSDNAGHLFFVHDGSGEIEAYIEFCNHLKEEFNCWGIKAEKPTTAAPQNVTIEEVAAKYTEKIKRIQPHGPYHIAGWSIGGTIAFEMIRQLERNGENIKFLAVIDAPAPPKDLPAGGSGFTVESELGFVQPYLKDKEIIGKLKKVSDISHFWSLFVGYLESSSLNDSDLTEKVRQVITEYEAHVVPDYHQLSIGQLIRYLNLGRTFRNARALYSPDEKINVPIYYFGASQSKGTIKKDNWNDYSRNPITFCEVTGDHFSIFKVPQVVELAKAFGRIVK